MRDFLWRPCVDHGVERLLRDQFRVTPVDLRRLVRTSINTLWLVDTPDGALVLKRLGRRPEPAWLRFQHDAIVLAARHGIPVHPLLQARDGSHSAFADDVYWQLRPYVDGRLYRDGDTNDLAAAAAQLDILHSLPLTDLTAADVNPVQDMEFWLPADATALDELSRVIRGLVTEHLWAQVMPAFQTAYHRARAELDKARYDALPRVLTHGEFAGSNLIFSEDGAVRGVLDWDAVGIRPRAYDLARAALFLSRTARGSFVIHPEMATALLMAATRHRPVEPAELAALVPILELYCVPTPRYVVLFAKRSREQLEWFLRWSAEGAATVRVGMAEAIAQVPV
ncbi:phosphotransferase [Nonomuraea sp. NPDC004297]